MHLSRPVIHDRIRRMEQNGVIRRYSAHIDWEAVGLPLTAFIWLRTALPCHPIGEQIISFSDQSILVEECHRVAGEWCMLAKVRAASSLALQALLDRIFHVQGVQNTMTTIVLSTIDQKESDEAPSTQSERENGHQAAGTAVNGTQGKTRC